MNSIEVHITAEFVWGPFSTYQYSLHAPKMRADDVISTPPEILECSKSVIFSKFTVSAQWQGWGFLAFFVLEPDSNRKRMEKKLSANYNTGIPTPSRFQHRLVQHAFFLIPQYQPGGRQSQLLSHWKRMQYIYLLMNGLSWRSSVESKILVLA